MFGTYGGIPLMKQNKKKNDPFTFSASRVGSITHYLTFHAYIFKLLKTLANAHMVLPFQYWIKIVKVCCRASDNSLLTHHTYINTRLSKS